MPEPRCSRRALLPDTSSADSGARPPHRPNKKRSQRPFTQLWTRVSRSCCPAGPAALLDFKQDSDPTTDYGTSAWTRKKRCGVEVSGTDRCQPHTPQYPSSHRHRCRLWHSSSLGCRHGDIPTRRESRLRPLSGPVSNESVCTNATALLRLIQAMFAP